MVAPAPAMTTTGYLAPPGLEDTMLASLSGVFARFDRLVLARGEPQPCPWAQNVWYDVQRATLRSIGDAARQLKAVQRNWAPYAHRLHRRTELIQAQLPHVGAKPLAFPAPAPRAKLGSWTLENETTMWWAATCSSPFPNGEAAFVEDHVNPPSRAYLKLYEALTLLGARPQPGERCLELGACPGGWTWVLRGLGAEVTAVDRAELDPRLMADPLVRFVKGDAFAELPGRFDWLLSDVICYPEKLLQHVKNCLATERARNFICTLKFQGDSHYDAIGGFAAIPGSRLVHLWHNKHELTWMLYTG
jgi:23S rRNA (cytidine2498-2'-O)-methyltransferase